MNKLHLSFCMFSLAALYACSDNDVTHSASLVAGNLVTYFDEAEKPSGYFMIQLMNDSATGSLDETRYVGFNILLKGKMNGELASGNYYWNPTAYPGVLSGVGIVSVKRHLRKLDGCGGFAETDAVADIVSASLEITTEDAVANVLEPTYRITFLVHAADGDISGSYHGKLHAIRYIGISPNF